MANGNPSPGWYQDPRDPAQVRWWDGGGWTQNTQPMPGAAQPEVPQTPAAPEPSFEQPADPWAAASQAPVQQPEAPAQPEQQWGQTPVQPEQQWGQTPVQPEQQWGQTPAQPEQQWGQTPVQPEQQWGQTPVQPEQQWGQTPAQPGAEGGWQQQQPGAWGSAVPPAPVPGGLAPGSPMGQTNVFPTSETVDPITGMPVAPPETGSKTSGKRLAALVGGTLLVGLLILGLLWFFLFRGSGSEEGTTGSVDVTATFSGTVDPACADLGAALTADDLANTVATRLNDVAVAKDLEENQAYFEQLGKDIQPIMDQYQSACIAAVSAGNAPEFYRTFVETFQASVTDGEAVSTSALQNGGQVTPEEAERLRAEASKLQASSEAVVAVSGGPSASATPEASPTPVPSESLPASPAPETVVPSAIG